MPCETMREPGQTFTQRKVEVKDAIARLSAALANGRAKAVIDKATGAIAFAGWEDRRRVTDSCAARMVMSAGSALARQAIAKAEMLAGRSVSKTAMAQGIHSHDSGKTWHHGH